MPEPQYLLTLTHIPPDLSPTLLGQTVRLKRLPTTVGRGKDAGITVKHRSLSRLHCRFYMTHGRLAVKDLASTNGTLINGHRITEDCYIQVGDQITFGSVVFKLSLLDTESPHRLPQPVENPEAEPSPDVTIKSDANVASAGNGDPGTDRLPIVEPGGRLQRESADALANVDRECKATGEGNGESLNAPQSSQAPADFQAEESVVFFGADEKLAGTARTNEGDPDSGGEREMAVESAGERENVQSLMERHQLPMASNAPKEDTSPLSIDEEVSSKTPIIQDRPEDRNTDKNVIDVADSASSPQVSSVNIETSFVAKNGPVDLGDFRPKGSTSDSSELVIEDPQHIKDASMTALGEFFKQRKSD